MNKRFAFLFTAAFLTLHCSAQKPFELGAEYMRSFGKGYNSARAALRGESFSNKSSFSAGLTYQLASKKSYSVSRGFGLYVGYRYAFSNKTPGNSPFLGARVLFSLENFEGQSSSNSLFITPWAEAGYHFIFAKYFFAAPSVGYGFTRKMSKDYNSLNEDDGGRFIPSLSAGYRL
ncbi:MAG: hypothetical protein SGI83_04290 [Bacteroidota bacterium]|nr:hypothetical protein [Bacteroidota bacterium]